MLATGISILSGAVAYRCCFLPWSFPCRWPPFVSGSYCSSPLNNVTEAAAAFPENFPRLLCVIKLGYNNSSARRIQLESRRVKLQDSVDLYMSPTTKIKNQYAANMTSCNEEV